MRLHSGAFFFAQGSLVSFRLALNVFVQGFFFGGDTMNDKDYMRLALQLAKRVADGHLPTRWWVPWS